MSTEKAEPGVGDILTKGAEQRGALLVISSDGVSFDAVTRLLPEFIASMGLDDDAEGIAEMGDCQTDATFESGYGIAFNVFDLLAGDPSAWAAALRFAPPEAVTAAFIAQCEAEGKGKELREGLRGEMWALPGHDGPQVLRWLNLSALLEPEAGSEPSGDCQASALALAPPEVVIAAFVAQCHADGRAKRVRSLAYAPVNDWALIEEVLKRAGLLGLLDLEAASQEGRP